MAVEFEPTAEEVAAIVARPYGRVLTPEPEGGFSARVLEFPGCISEGDTAEEAIAMIDEALGGVLFSMLKHGDRIPEPLLDAHYGGRISLRIPPTLHAEAVELANALGVSLNRFLSDAIARHVGAMKVSVG